MTVVRSQLLRKRDREDRREGRAEEEEEDDDDDDDDYEDSCDGEYDDVDGLRLPNGFIILNDDESDDDESHYYPRVDYGNDDGDDREEESMGEEIECYFAGKASTTATNTVPLLALSVKFPRTQTSRTTPKESVVAVRVITTGEGKLPRKVVLIVQPSFQQKSSLELS